MRTKLVGGVAVAAAAMMALTACTGSTGTTNGASSGDGATSASGIPAPKVQCDIPEANINGDALDTSAVQGEITFMTQGLKGTFDDYVNGKIKEFQDAHPGTTITWTDTPGADDFDTQMVTQASNCSMADVINVPASSIAALSQQDLLLDLDVKAPDLGADYLPNVWDQVKFAANEHHNAVPWYFGPYLTTYNKEVFQKAGLDPEKPPTTMTEYFADAQKIADSGTGDYAVYGNTSWYMVPQWRAFGVQMMNDDFTEFTFAKDPKALEWVTQMADLYKKGAIPKDSMTGDLDQSKAYGEGNLAFGTPNASFLRNVQENAAAIYDKTGVGEEARESGVNPLFDGQYLAVSVTSKNAALATEWMKFFTSPEAGLDWAKYGIDTGKAVVFPGTTKALEDPSLADVPGDGVFDQARRVAAKEAVDAEAYIPMFYITGQVSSTLQDNVNQAIVGDLDPQEALDKAQEGMNTLLQRVQQK